MRRLSLAVIAIAALSGCARGASDQLNVAIRELHYRPVEGRLSSLPYAPFSRDRRLRPAEALAESNLGDAARRSRSPLTPLFFGSPAGAKRELEKITATGRASAAQWNDYAVLLHATAPADDILQLATALAATEHALELDAAFPAALFNRAFILDAISLRGPATAAYDAYLKIDSSSQWAGEVRMRRDRLHQQRAKELGWQSRLPSLERAAADGDALFVNDSVIAFPEESRRWGESIFLGDWAEAVLANDPVRAQKRLALCRLIGASLETQRGESLLADTARAIDASRDAHAIAKAVVLYQEGRKSYARRDLRQALRAFKAASQQLASTVDPMALLARYHTAAAYLDLGHEVEAMTLLRDVERRASSRYRALRAELVAMEAARAANGGAHDFALESFRKAAGAFDALGEEQRATRIRESAANVMRSSGDVSEAWSLRRASLASATGRAEEWQIATTVYSMAIDAIAEERWDVAYALLNVVSEMHNGPQDAATWRIVAAKRGGMPRTADVHLAKARDAGAANLQIVEALIADDQGDAVRLLTKALEITRLTGATQTRMQLLLERAKALRATGNVESADADVDEATALMNKQVFISTPRDGVLSSTAVVNSMFADLYDIRGETLRALQASERARIEQGAATFRIPSQTTLITYGISADRIVIYTLNARKTHRAEVKVGANRVRKLVAEFLRTGDTHGLSRVLLWPIQKALVAGDRIVFVLDPDLRPIPFTALRKENERYLIQDHPVAADTSITAFLRGQNRETQLSSALLSVGNSTCDTCDESLPLLSGAEAEAREVADMYRSRVTLVRERATKARVIGALPYSNTAHFAVHANAGLGDVVPPHLVLAPARGDDGRLTASDIAKLKLGGIRTVVLAGCRTAASSPRQAGTQSLVDAFLRAGVGSVIGTLWDVDDASTREMSIAFHRALRNGATPAKALQSTQVEMIRRKAPMRVWAALQLYGAGS